MRIRPVATGPPGCVASLSLNTPTLKKAGPPLPLQGWQAPQPQAKVTCRENEDCSLPG